LHERLDRTLEQIKPEIVLACYGMNCGIYHPYRIDRFEAFKVGMRRLRDRVRASGAEMIHLTPPVFDPLPIAKRTLPAGLKSYSGPYAGYDEVLNLYAAWLIAMRSEGWNVIDIHGPMKAALLLRRQSDPMFHFAGDGVHMNAEAHWLTAQLIMRGLGAPNDLSAWSSAEAMVTSFFGKETEYVSLIKSKQRMLCDTWLTHIGHLRPGMAKGLTLDAAKTKSIEMDSQIESLLK
jgi:lysophospholipase L1-like esterase